MRNIIRFGLLILIWVIAPIATPVYSQSDIVEFQDAQKQALYLKLIKELRCLVCQNQTLADSNADLAKDLRNKTYEQINQGKNYDEIVDYMVDRYGDFVRYRPPLKSKTALLWIGPFVLLLLIVILAIRRIRETPQSDTTFSNEEMEKARNLIDSS